MKSLERRVLSQARIVHLNTARTWRGGEQQVLYLAGCIKAAGGSQLVIGQPASELEKKCRGAGIDFASVSMRAEIDIFAARNVSRICREFGANILHAHTAKAHGLSLLVKRLFPLKLIVSRRVDFHRRQNFLSRRKYLSANVDLYLAISENVKKILMDDGIDGSRIRIAYSGIDPGRFQSLLDPAYLRREFLLTGKETIFVNVAALVDHKDQETLVKACAMLAENRPRLDFRVFIVGDGELRESLARTKERLNLGNRVVFTGFRPDVSAFLAIADVFVMSSKEEGLGTSVLDAMACGLPVACTDAGGLPEMIEPGKGGLITGARNAAALAGSMGRLAGSAGLRTRMGRFNRGAVRRFSHEATFRMTLNAYDELLLRGRPEKA